MEAAFAYQMQHTKQKKYAVLLFFVAVKTNVDYQVVGSFAIQDETTDCWSVVYVEVMESAMEGTLLYDW